MSETNETSLHFNLTQCLRALRKIRELYKNSPAPIQDHLANLEEVVILCQCAALDDEMGVKNSSKIYWYILDSLIEITNPRRLSLQLYFCKSPYWEHYDRNITEIMLILDQVLAIGMQQQPQPRKRSASGSSYGPETEFGDVMKFQRKFVPFSRVVLDRQWGAGLRGKSLTG